MKCPECDHDVFHTDHHATVRRFYHVTAGGHVSESAQDEEVIDVDRDFDTIICDACGWEGEPDEATYGRCDECDGPMDESRAREGYGTCEHCDVRDTDADLPTSITDDPHYVN